MRDSRDRVCPLCGGEGVEDYVREGGRPSQRVLAEAIYEVTSAQAVVAGGLKLDTITVGLLVLAARYSNLYILQDTDVPRYLNRVSSRLNCSLSDLLESLIGALKLEERV
jgi:hypothetical protein